MEGGVVSAAWRRVFQGQQPTDVSPTELRAALTEALGSGKLTAHQAEALRQGYIRQRGQDSLEQHPTSLLTPPASSSLSRSSSSWLAIQVAPSSKATEQQDRVRAWLQGNVRLIRVSTENGSNFGHQSAAVALLSELRELGFVGALECVIPPGAEMKMPTLLPGFNAEAKSQTLGGVRFMSADTADDLRQDPGVIGFMAASDHDDKLHANDLGVSACITLQPHDWTADRRIEFRGERMQLDLPQSSSYVWTPKHLTSEADIDAALLGHASAARRKAIVQLLGGVKAGSADLLPIYGLHHPAVREQSAGVLANLFRAASAFQKRRRSCRPVVLLALGSELPPKLAEDIKVVPFEKLSEALANAEDTDVFVVHAGTVPRPLFESFYAAATLPSVLEGANTSTLAQLLGKPFLSVFSATTELPNASGSADTAQAKAFVQRSSDELRIPAEQRISELGRLLQMFAQMQFDLPHGFQQALRQAIESGYAFGEADTAHLSERLTIQLASSRPLFGLREHQAIAGLIANTIADLTEILASLHDLPDDVRRDIAAFDGRSEDAAATADRISRHCKEALHAHNDARLAAYFEQASDPHSLVSAYFGQAQNDLKSPKNRQVLQSLDSLRAMMEASIS